MKPSTLMLLGGGVVLLISTLLDWVSAGPFGANAWDTDFFGLLGIICALIGLAIAGWVAATEFGNLSLPDKILGFNHNQVRFILASEALVITVGFIVRGDVGIGLWLGLLASAVMVAGAYMEMKGHQPASANPTQF